MYKLHEDMEERPDLFGKQLNTGLTDILSQKRNRKMS